MKIKKLIEIIILIFAISTTKAYCKASLKTYFDSDKTQALDFKFIAGQVKFAHQEGKVNTGIAAFSDAFAKNISFQLLSGNLSLGGSLSKLNNPLLSTSSSPFSSGFSSVDSFTASLPSYTSFSNPTRLFLQCGNLFKKSAFIHWKLNCFYSPEDKKNALSFYLNKNFFKNQLKLTGQISLGIFPHKENSISSWFTNEFYYHQGMHLCSNYQVSFEYKNFKTSFLQGLYETPFGSITSLFRSDNRLITDRFIFTLSTLYNPNKKEKTIITSSDKILENCIQCRFGLQYKYRTGKAFPIFIKNAFATYCNLSLASKEGPHDLRFCTGSQFTCPYTSNSLTLNVNGTLYYKNNTPSYSFDSLSIKLQNSAYIWAFNPGFNASVTLNPSQNFDSLSVSTKLGLQLTYSKFPKISGTASITLNHIDGELTSKKLSASLKSTFTYKDFSVILKLSADTSI